MNTYTRLNNLDRERISQGLWKGETFADIARRINRPECTIGREVWRNIKSKKRSYQALKASLRAVERATSKKTRKLEVSSKLQEYVYQKLRADWSPEEIAERLKLEYPKNKNMRVSHETIYQHLYCLPKGELKKELMKGLRQVVKQRQRRANIHLRRERIEQILSISERPKETETRTIPGHWEGDLIVGIGHKSAIGTLVERTTRLTLLVPLQNKDAVSVSLAFAKAFKRIPTHLKKTLTYDRGSEMSAHKFFTQETGIKVYFADPYSPWQRGTNENTNGLIRQYFPKGTDFSLMTRAEIKKVEEMLNSRPRKVLQFYTPMESFYSLITKKKLALDI